MLLVLSFHTGLHYIKEVLFIKHVLTAFLFDQLFSRKLITPSSCFIFAEKRKTMIIIIHDNEGNDVLYFKITFEKYFYTEIYF